MFGFGVRGVPARPRVVQSGSPSTRSVSEDVGDARCGTLVPVRQDLRGEFYFENTHDLKNTSCETRLLLIDNARTSDKEEDGGEAKVTATLESTATTVR